MKTATCYGAVGGARGCGKGRTKGDVYFELGVGPGGVPVEHFLTDPPMPLDVFGQAGAPKVGVKLIQVGNIWHILDGIGSCHYPNVADFIEEVRMKGVSRKLPKNILRTQGHLLTRDSKLIVWHSRAQVDNWQEYGNYRYTNDEDCVKNLPKHRVEVRNECCASIWWNDLPDGYVSIADITYRGCKRPADLEPIYRPATVGIFPCSRLAVVKGEHQDGLDAARMTGFRVDEVDE